MEIISVKITSVFETGAVKAKANAVLGRFGVRGIKVCEGKSGLFVAMPSYKSAKGKYIDIFFPMDKEAKEELAGAVYVQIQIHFPGLLHFPFSFSL